MRLGAANAPDLAVPEAEDFIGEAAAAGRSPATGDRLRRPEGGVKFVAGYPITPATEILEWLAHAIPNVAANSWWPRTNSPRST